MNEHVMVLAAGRSRALRAILWAGLAAGTLDLSAAFIAYSRPGVGPFRILQHIASGLLGRDAFQGGYATAALGAFAHYAILLVAAALYYSASRKLLVLNQRPWLHGPLYGVAIYAFMNLVVLPLSAVAHKPSYPLAGLALGLGIHMVCVGLPIALAVRRFAPQAEG